jgi:hypothetical protein
MALAARLVPMQASPVPQAPELLSARIDRIVDW